MSVFGFQKNALRLKSGSLFKFIIRYTMFKSQLCFTTTKCCHLYPTHLNLFILCTKEFAERLHSYFEVRYSQVCNSLQSTPNDLL